MQLHRIISSLLFIGAIGVASPSMAKPINLYEQPNASSKMVQTIDSSAGIITIYTPKEGEWVKVADPRNGNVGWIKASDLSNSKMSFNFITTGESPQGYQFIQIGNTRLTTEKMQQAVKQFEVQQQNFQKEMQTMMQNILSNSQWRFPLIMPVVITPEKPTAAPTAKTTEVKPTPDNK